LALIAISSPTTLIRNNVIFHQNTRITFKERKVTSLEIFEGKWDQEMSGSNYEILSLNIAQTAWLKVTYNEKKYPITSFYAIYAPYMKE
jgi:hypothetical protein